MKKHCNALYFSIICMLLLVSLSGCSIKKKVPADWYDVTIDIYKTAFTEGWPDTDTYQDLWITDEYRDPSLKFGYYLVDLNGDGADELLIGYDNGDKPTIFTDVYIWHSSVGAYRVLNVTGDGKIYLLSDKIIRLEDVRGDLPTVEYLEYNTDGDTFLNLDGDSGIPIKVDLTYFK